MLPKCILEALLNCTLGWHKFNQHLGGMSSYFVVVHFGIVLWVFDGVPQDQSASLGSGKLPSLTARWGLSTKA